jgi:integrase
MTRINNATVAKWIKQGSAKPCGVRYTIGQSVSLHVKGRSALYVFKYRDPIKKIFTSEVLGSAVDLTWVDALAATKPIRERLRAGTALASPRGASASGQTFAQVMEAWIKKRSTDKWSADASEEQSYRRLMRETPAFCALPVASITSDDVAAALRQYVARGTLVGADKHRKRIKAAMEYAILRGWRTLGNPAKAGVIAQPKSEDETHHPALPWPEVPAFMKRLLTSGTAGSRALAFIILTASRAGKVQTATWSQVRDGIWSPDGNSNKGAVPVPLTPAMLALIGKPGEPDASVFGVTKHAFDGVLAGLPSDVAGRAPTIHGFRSTFRTWARANKKDSETAELCLGHTVGSKTSRAYDRVNETLALRRELLASWSAFAMGSKVARGVPATRR